MAHDNLKYEWISLNSGKPYILNFKSVTCQCLDFKHRRSKEDKTDSERLCTHFKDFLKENPAEIENILKNGGSIPIEYIPVGLVHLLNPSNKPKIPFKKAVEVMETRLQPILDNFILDFRISKYHYCGSFRRLLDAGNVSDSATVGDIDIIFLGEVSIAEIRDLIKPEEILSNGPQVSMMMVDGVHVDINKIWDAKKYIFKLLRATGSKNENIRLSKIANEQGYSLNEYGFYSLSEEGKRVESEFLSEKDIYQFLNEPYRSPSERNPEQVATYYCPGEVISVKFKNKSPKNTEKDIEHYLF